MTWRFTVVRASDDQPDGELVSRTNPRVTWRLRGPQDATFSLDGRNAEARWVPVDLTRDLVVSFDGVPQWRGRIVQDDDDIAEDHRTTISAWCYRSYLTRARTIQPGSTVAFLAEQTNIAWQLIVDAQAVPGGSMGITRLGGTPPGDPVRETTREVGQYVGSVIDELAALSDGFDWDVDALRRFVGYYPRRGGSSGLILDYGGTVTVARRNRDWTQYGNATSATGDSALGAASLAFAVVADIAAREEGRWEKHFGLPDARQFPVLQARLNGLLAEWASPPVAWTVTLRPGVWEGLETAAPGDWALLVVRSGRVDVSVPVRIQTIDLRLSDDGTANVSMTVLEDPLYVFGPLEL